MSTSISQANIFDYAVLDSQVRLNVEGRTARIHARNRRMAGDVIANGLDLIAVKADLEHGQFELWLRSEFNWGLTTAWRFVRVAEVFKSSNLEDIGIATSALYLLAAPSTPEPARIEALERAESGEPITYSKARQIVNEYKPIAEPEDRLPFEPDEQDNEEASNWADTYAHIVAPPKANHQLINTSTSNEWYTPRRYLDAVHAVMGGVDLDPASNPLANENVRADRYFTIDDDGLAHDWRGRVFLNPPYGASDGESNQARWSRRLIDEYKAGNVTEAVLLVNAVPGNQWFAPLWQFPICFPDHRIRFYNAEVEAGQPTHSNALIYLGPNVSRFVECFSAFGVVAGRLASEDGNVSVSIKL